MFDFVFFLLIVTYFPEWHISTTGDTLPPFLTSPPKTLAENVDLGNPRFSCGNTSL